MRLCLFAFVCVNVHASADQFFVCVAANAFGAAWTAVTVDINEYHNFSDKVFRLHFRMSKRVFEVSLSSDVDVSLHCVMWGSLC